MGHNELLIPEGLRTRDRDEALVDALRAVADELGASVAQVAIAWALSPGETA